MVIPVLTADQATAWDRDARETYGIPARVLMESAGRAAVSVIAKEHGPALAKGVIVVCGRGNNGGDGWVVARALAALGVSVTVVALDGEASADNAANRALAEDRSVVLFGTGRIVEDDLEKMAALEAITEHLIPGRWKEARLPNRREINATLVVSIEIDEASAKVRTGAPLDDAEDYDLPVWAGVLPLREATLSPIRDEVQSKEVTLPPYIADYSRNRR